MTWVNTCLSGEVTVVTADDEDDSDRPVAAAVAAAVLVVALSIGTGLPKVMTSIKESGEGGDSKK